MTYSLEFRRQVLATKEKQGLTFEETGKLFGLSSRSLQRWSVRLEPCKKRNIKPRKIDKNALVQDVLDYPDDYQWERAKRFGVSDWGIGAALKRWNITHEKKTLEHPKADEKKRLLFQAKIQNYEKEGKPIIYIDESGFAVDQPRTHGYSQKGKRCFGLHNWHEKGRINAIGALIGFSFLTVMLLNTSINSDIFYAWVTQELLPRIPQYSVVVMDNAPFHKRKDIQEAFDKQHVILEYLPSYSPDLNPIEKKWAQAKAIRKQQRCNPLCLFAEHIHYDNL